MGLALDAGHLTFDLADLALHCDEVVGQERIEPVDLDIQGINAIGEPHVERYDCPEDHNDRPDDRPDNSDYFLCRHASPLHRNGAVVKNNGCVSRHRGGVSFCCRTVP